MQGAWIDEAGFATPVVVDFVGVTGKQIVGLLKLEPFKLSARITMSDGDSLLTEIDHTPAFQARSADDSRGLPEFIEIVVTIPEDEKAGQRRELVNNAGNRQIATMDQRFRSGHDELRHSASRAFDLIVAIRKNTDQHAGLIHLAFRPRILCRLAFYLDRGAAKSTVRAVFERGPLAGNEFAE